ncbi:MAG: CBS domain-containing protein [Methanobacteriaceae archaeon]|jgi:CBS domain-containing protein|nr:CBS domain-containing protein [Candidatus Methanorudis spinitermitis]
MQIKNIMSEEIVTIDKDQIVFDGLKLMKKHRISRLPVINANEKHEKELVGIISEKDIAIKLGSSKYGDLPPSHFHISTVMTKDLITVHKDKNVVDVANLLLETHVGGVPIMEKGKMVGIVSKSDFIDTCKGKAYEKILVEEVMSTDLVSVSSQDRLMHARRVMLDSKIGRLLISENNELAGILSSKDIIRAMISFKKEVPPKHRKAKIKECFVEQYMTTNVKKINSKTTIAELANDMLKTGYNGYPVVNEENQVVGIITQSDLLALIIELENE